jgi:D-psicose/D-tagatose/L-ribulose 3-epimerase
MSPSRREFLMAIGAAPVAVRAFGKIGNVQIGVCKPPRDLEKAVQYGFDYLEPEAVAIHNMSDAEFSAFKKQVLASPIRCECYNILFPGRNMRVVGDHVNWDTLDPYLEKTFSRCRQLGGTIVVWGSSGSRNVSPGYPRARAWKQIQEFLRRAGAIARRHGLIVAIEPLRHQESNIINTGAEAMRLVQEVHHPNVRMIIDYYHLREENESPEIIWTVRRYIVHFHFANPHGRVWPKSPSEDPEYAEFFRMVKKIRFRGGISIEARGTFAADGRASLAFFRRELTAA